MKRMCVLGSGSKGNCTFIESGSTRILIDVGLSARQIELRLDSIGVKPETIEAICITHDHVDHYQGARVFCNRWKAHLYANVKTKRGIIDSHDLFYPLNWKSFKTNESFRVGSILIHSFCISHDAHDPVGFVLMLGKIKIGFCTDLGIATESVYEALTECEVIVLETNHDPRMLVKSERPESNKKRIAGKKGHLSNQAAAEFAVRLAKAGKLKRLYLAHLSEECNRESIARKTVSTEFRKNGISNVGIYMTHQRKKALVWKETTAKNRKSAGDKKRKLINSDRKKKANTQTKPFLEWLFG